MKLHIFKKNKQFSGSKVKEFIAKLSRGLMLPIAILPIAGLFLGIGAGLVNIAELNPENINIYLQAFGNIIKQTGEVIFACLPVLFAIAIAIAFTGDAGVPALSALVGYLVMCGFQSALIIKGQTDPNAVYFLYYQFDKRMFDAIFGSNLGITSLNSGVFGGIIVGFVVAYLYNKYKNIQLPAILGFFNGVRFIPIVTFVSCIIVSMLFALLWPSIGQGLYQVGKALGQMNEKALGFNSFIFGYVERALVPLGLHHAFYTPLWYTSAGGTLDLTKNATVTLNDQVYEVWYNGIKATTWYDVFYAISPSRFTAQSFYGDQSVWFALYSVAGKSIELKNGADTMNQVLTFDFLTNQFKDGGINPGQYMQGKYPFMMFGLPAAAAAMIMLVPKENRKMSLSIIGSAALTSFLTGITEPIEFTFLFLAPWLFWGVHAFFAATSFWLMNLLGAHMGMTFSGGFIDFIIYGAMPDATGAIVNSWIPVCLGLGFIPIYFFTFYFLIKKFDIKTPGRDNAEIKLVSKKEYLETKALKKDQMTLLATEVIKAYGNKENIVNVDACITKLRIEVKDQAAVDFDQLKKLGAAGVMKIGDKSVYAVFGTKADIIKNKIKEIL